MDYPNPVSDFIEERMNKFCREQYPDIPAEKIEVLAANREDGIVSYQLRGCKRTPVTDAYFREVCSEMRKLGITHKKK